MEKYTLGMLIIFSAWCLVLGAWCLVPCGGNTATKNYSTKNQESMYKEWTQLLDNFNASLGVKETSFKTLEAAYTGKERHYHNLAHITFMLEGLAPFADKIEDIVALKTAIWFHDVVYNSLKKDNETKSADWAVQFLQEVKADIILQEKVRYMIEKTQFHMTIDSDEDFDTQLLLDLDLAILGQSTERYALYKDQVRKEYKWVPFLLYKRNRKKVLKKFLEMSFIYRTPFFRESLEEKARANLAREIKTL